MGSKGSGRSTSRAAGGGPDGETKTPRQKKLSIQHVHVLLGHMNEKACQKTCKALGWEVTCGSLDVCLPCTIAKAKQKNIKTNDEPVHDGKTSICLDLTSVKKPKDVKYISQLSNYG
jgi:hypothetical protein